jgi:hypothetical protein
MTAKPADNTRRNSILMVLLLGNLLGLVTGEVVVRVLGHSDAEVPEPLAARVLILRGLERWRGNTH